MRKRGHEGSLVFRWWVPPFCLGLDGMKRDMGVSPAASARRGKQVCLERTRRFRGKGDGGN